MQTSASGKRRRSPNPMFHEHIPPRYLPNLLKYKYSGSDSSLLGNFVMQRWWSAVVQLVPLSVAPNALTLAGFTVSLSSTLLIAYYMFFKGAVYPAFVWYYAAFALFSYQTLDAIDGKQARRTFSSSPMGELFDHGCDAFFTPMLQFNICAAMNFTGRPAFYFFVLICASLYFTIWEQFSTTALTLGYINGPTEGVLITCGVFLVTGLMGPVWWSQPLWDSPLRIPVPFLASSSTIDVLSYRDILFLAVVLSALLTILTNFLHVFTHESSRGRLSAISAVVPIVVIMVGMLHLFEFYPEIVEPLPYVFEVTFGLLFSYTATRMTVARLCEMPFNPFSAIYIATVALVLSPFVAESFLGIQRNAVITWLPYEGLALLALSIYQYLHMMVAVFSQISRFLDLNILTFTNLQLEQIKRAVTHGQRK